MSSTCAKAARATCDAADSPPSATEATSIVIDTNVALDLLLYNDPSTKGLKHALNAGTLCWLATAAMRHELARVLEYPKIAARRERANQSAAALLAQWDCWTQTPSNTRPEAMLASVVCKDPDDQMFINLAVQHVCPLLSKDAEVLKLQKPLRLQGVAVSRVWDRLVSAL
jgi:predicted nucleic acid-binding protein